MCKTLLLNLLDKKTSPASVTRYQFLYKGVCLPAYHLNTIGACRFGRLRLIFVYETDDYPFPVFSLHVIERSRL